MMLALLVTLTLAVLLLPMLPALSEWRLPQDAQPLPIDEADALDPPYLARSFAARLAGELQSDDTTCGHVQLVHDDAAPALSADEQGARASRRRWHGLGLLQLPPDVAFQAEVSADGALRTGTRGRYQVLWSAGSLRVAPHSTVARWLHGRQVMVESGCQLIGRATADATLTLAGGVDFALLHAPTLQFGVPLPSSAAPLRDTRRLPLEGVTWDAQHQRALCAGPLVVPDGRSWYGDVVCEGDLTLGRHCSVQGSLRTRGILRLGAGCRVSGSLFADGGVVLAPYCEVQGVVVSETRVTLAAGTVVGRPDTPATVVAPDIAIEPGVRVHGTVWASVRGRSLASGHQPSVAALGGRDMAVVR